MNSVLIFCIVLILGCSLQDGPVAADCLDGKQICVLFFWPVGQGDVAAAVGQINQLYTALKQSPQANEIEVVFVDSSEGGNQASFDQVLLAPRPQIAQ